MSRVALLVATTDYIDSGLRRLRSPATDARHLGALLEDKSIGYFDRVVPLVNESKAEIEEHIERVLKDLLPSDTLLLYMSCHGIRDRHGRLFFTTLRTKRDLPESTAISARFIEEQMSRCRARGKVLLLDCCFGGAYVQGMAPFAPEDGELSAQAAGKGTYVMTASDVLEFAFEGDQVKNRSGAFRSVFTEAVIDGLSTGRADIDNDGVITAHELFQHIARHVRESGAPQTPTEFRSGVQGNVPIAKAALWHQGGTETDPFSSGSLPLGELLPALATSPERGLCAPDWPPNGQLTVPLGRMYDPVQGLQETLTLDLSGGAPHVGVVGGRWSGKTSVLLTLACSLALTHTPEELQIYALHGEPDGMTRLAPLPHVGTVANYADGDSVRFVVEGVTATLRRRERLSDSLRIRSPKIFRTKRMQRTLKGERYGEVFLFIDSWPDFEARFPDASRQLLSVARNGVYYGIHLAVSADRWDDLPSDLTLHLGTWIELSLADPRESRIDSHLAGGIPPGQPGFGLTRGRRCVRLAFPALARSRTAQEGAALSEPVFGAESEELDHLVSKVSEAWQRPAARPLETLTDGEESVPRLLDLLNLPDEWHEEPASAWVQIPSQQLTTPLGVDTTGAPVVLDLKEAAQGGWGPHGLCVGATGSGKSELLRTVVFGLAVTHSSEMLNFVLADFKGGATFAGMATLPHVAAVITNLADDLTLVDRMSDSIRGELARRQELLRDAGNYSNVRAYEKARAAGAPLQAIPALVLVIDEFSELLAEKPDFLEMFVQIGRLGRMLGVHLLLASQRLEDEHLRALEPYLSYRIGLRTFSAAESRAALGVPDAYHLSSGFGYLKFDMDHMVGFRAAHAFGWDEGDERSTGDEPAMDLVLSRLAEQGPPAHQVWLPPLDLAPPLDALLPGLAAIEGRGLTAPGYGSAGHLVVPIGVVDKPYEQRRDLLWMDFTGAAGHMQITGGPQSGKSTLLRTLISSFSLTHNPYEVQFYCIDFGGGGLASVSGLPHVGAVASRLDPERVRRTVAKVYEVLTRREEYFRSAGISSITEYRARRARNEISVTDQPWGDVFLVIDGWGNFSTEQSTLEPAVLEIAARGLGYGIHLVLTASRSTEVQPNLKDHLISRLELRLGDPKDSEIDPRAAADLPTGSPGHGQTSQRLHFLAALPRIDGLNTDTDLVGATTALANEIARHWRAPGAPEVQLLPSEVPVSELPSGDRFPERGIAFALDENNLEPVFVNFDQDPFFLVFGESESGKSNLLRLLITQLTQRYRGDECKFFVVDNRRSLLDATPASHLAEYIPLSNTMDHHVAALAELMQRRTPSADVTPQQLRDRSWWQGPTVYVVIDDYDLVSTASGNPLSVLSELLHFARDVGVRFIIARSTAGAGRSMYEPFMQRMRELGAQGLVMSGDSGEGDLLGGVRPRPVRPGRGIFISRQREKPLVQTGHMPERAG